MLELTQGVKISFSIFRTRSNYSLFLKLSITFSAVLGHWRCGRFDFGHVIFNNCVHFGLVYFNAGQFCPKATGQMLFKKLI